MGFLDALGGAIKSGVDKANKIGNEQTAELAMTMSLKSSEELIELFNSVEKAISKRAIILALAMKNDTNTALKLAEGNSISRRSFEGFLENRDQKISEAAQALLINWPK